MMPGYRIARWLMAIVAVIVIVSLVATAANFGQ